MRKVAKLIKLLFYWVLLGHARVIRFFLDKGKGTQELRLVGKKIAFFDTKIPKISSAGERSFIELYQYLEKYSSPLFLVKDGAHVNLTDDSIGNINTINAVDFLRTRRILSEIDYVFIMSPEAYLYFNALSLLLCINVRVVYYSTDVFSIRYKREFKSTRSWFPFFYSYYYKFSEPLIWNISVSCLANRIDEAEIIQKYNKNTSLVPTRVFSNLSKADLRSFDAIADGEIHFIFIGGSGNAPNISAVDFIVDYLLDELSKNLSRNFTIHIVGSGWRDYLRGKNHTLDNILIHGVVSDDELNELYNKCLFSLAPLQYGAGVKGKVIEAMLHSLVVVSTSVGVEGINCKTLKACETGECMVTYCNKVISGKDYWKEVVDGYYDYLDQNFSPSAMNKGLNITNN